MFLRNVHKFYQTTRSHIPVDINLDSYNCKNRQSRTEILYHVNMSILLLRQPSIFLNKYRTPLKRTLRQAGARQGQVRLHSTTPRRQSLLHPNLSLSVLHNYTFHLQSAREKSGRPVGEDSSGFRIVVSDLVHLQGDKHLHSHRK